MSTPLVTHPIDAELLDRYLARLTTSAESEHVQHWMASHPDHTLVVEALQRVPLEVNGGELTTDTEAWLARIDIRSRSPETWVTHRNVSVKGIGVLGRQPLPWGVFKAQSLRRGAWYTLAGAVVGIMALVMGQHVGLLPLGGHRTPPTFLTYATGNGERANITLPDGSMVALDVASRLEVPADYLMGDHTLRLMGEALFIIDHHDQIPFTVVAGLATARVLGTSFLMRHYTTDSVTTVAVRDGKVAVHSTGMIRPVVLTAARETEIGQTGSGRIQVADPTQFSFAAGKLTLKDVPLPQAIAELDRWYDADIRLGDPALKALGITGEYAAGSLADLAGILEVTFNIRVMRDGRILTLFPR